MSIINNKNIALSLYGLLFIYQMIGVAVHKQYGFGFFYWPVQEYGLLALSLFAIIINFDKFKALFEIGILYHVYVFIVLIFLIVYISESSLPYANFLDTQSKISILMETINWYVISLVMSFYFKQLLEILNIKNLTTVYIIILIIFFAYVLHLNGSDIERSFIMGANFATKDINIYLSASGYVKGFHLYFSPLFSVFSIFYIYYLKRDDKYAFIISLLSIYILYLAGGRGSMVAFSFAVFLIMTNTKSKFIILFFIIMLLPFGSILEENNPRFYKLITLDVEKDPSMVGRIKDYEHNMVYVQDNILIGGLRGYKEINSAYIHSSLSILQEYGIVVFSIFILMILHAAIVLIKIRNQEEFKLFASIYVYTATDMLLFKYVHETKTMILFSIVYLSILLFRRNINVS